MVVPVVDVLLILTPLLWAPEQPKAFACMALLSAALLSDGFRYRARLSLSALDDLPAVLAKLLAAAAVIATVIALRHDQGAVAEFLSNVVGSIGLVLLGRAATSGLIRWARGRRLVRHRTVVVGSGPLAAEITRVLDQEARYGLHVVAHVDRPGGPDARPEIPWLEDLSDLDAIIRRTTADVLLVADPRAPEQELLDATRSPTCLPCDLLVVPRLHYLQTRTGSPDHIGSIPIMRIHSPRLDGPAWLAKRTLDIAVASAALVLLAPLLLATALAVRIEGGPGIIFRQPRVGRDGRLFECLKFRSMRPVDETDSATTWSIATDDRVGPVGRLIRRLSIDELPQLWNIIRGDMTLVGPRPERPHFVDQFSTQYERYAHRHRMPTGLTGLAQVSGLRGDTSIAERARYDNYYIENWSLWLDLKILVRTVSEVVLARGR